MPALIRRRRTKAKQRLLYFCFKLRVWHSHHNADLINYKFTICFNKHFTLSRYFTDARPHFLHPYFLNIYYDKAQAPYRNTHL